MCHFLYVVFLMKAIDVVKALLKWPRLFISSLTLFFLGLFMVAIALPFRVQGFSVSDGRPIVNLPRWAYVWGNDFDGALGDKRGWWAENTPFGVDVTSFLAMWWWLAIRNPSNNMRRLETFYAPITGSTITYAGDFIVEDDVDGGGWQFVKCVSAKGKTYYGFYLVKEYGERCLMIRLGHKIKPEHAGTVDQPKGFTFRFNPWKKL